MPSVARSLFEYSDRLLMTYRIIVAKQARTLSLVREDRVERNYPIVLGRNSAADKSVEGDHATPLGEFYICAKNPRSRYFLSLCISYPNAEDADRGLAAGLIAAEEYAEILKAIRARRMPPQHTRLGGEIYIHGRGTLKRGSGEVDGTRGCIALDDADMQHLYDRVALGTPVSIND
jgi:murein L,D-transpeptidase YafK